MATQPQAAEMTAQDYVALVNRFMDKGQTDGWPIIPAAPDVIDAFVRGTGRDPGEELGKYQLREKPITVREVATQAVMAGCLPEHFPVVLAAVEIFLPEAGFTAHSAGWAPVIVVNGPIRRRLGLNGGANVLGPGNRANATIGRALRLTLINLAGARTFAWDQSTQGSAYKYTCCLAEDEEHSPWEPFHVSLGYAAGDSVVTGWTSGRHPYQVPHTLAKTPEHVLGAIAEEMSTAAHYGTPVKPANWREITVLPDRPARTSMALIGPEHREILGAAGWDRVRVREELVRIAGRRVGSTRKAGVSGYGVYLPSAPDDRWVALMQDPAKLLIVAAGGPGGRSMVGGVGGLDSRRITASSVSGRVTTSSSAAAAITAVNDVMDGPEGDGLPVIPVTDEGVAALLEGGRRSPDEIIGTFAHNGAAVIAREVARSALMAGCLPQYMPVVNAAIELALPFSRRFVGPEGFFPWVIVNGPVRSAIALNSSQNVYGPTIRANAAIGRAIRLVLMNAGRIRPGELARSAFGHAYQYTCGVVGENEEDSPWAPVSTELGSAPSDSTVTVLIASDPHQASGHEIPTTETFLYMFADELSTARHADPSYGPLGALRPIVGMGSDARTHAKEQGWTRAQARRYVFERLVRKAGDLRRLGYDAGRLASTLADSDPVRLVERPEDIFVFASGGGGAHNMLSHMVEPPQIRRIG